MKPIDLIPDFATARSVARATGRCIAPPFGCGEPIGEFRDARSMREYEISFLCQECQDEVFGPGTEKGGVA